MANNMTKITPALKSEIAPTGKLRVGANMSNFLLTAKDPATGARRGLVVDLGHELGKRLGLPVEIVPFPNPGALADAAGQNVWDVGFIGAEPQRAKEIDFSPAYVEIEAVYLVPQGSPLKSIADVDKPGIRVITNERAAYELWLSRNLKHAKPITEKGADQAFKRFVDEKLEAYAGLKPRLTTDRDKLPGSRILDGRFTAVQQAAGTPKGRPLGAQYLCAFIEDIKSTGLVARPIAKPNVRGLTVAPPA